jgi:hypothetical protein
MPQRQIQARPSASPVGHDRQRRCRRDAQIKLNDVDYMRAVRPLLQASMMGSNLVFVVTLP